MNLWLDDLYRKTDREDKDEVILNRGANIEFELIGD